MGNKYKKFAAARADMLPIKVQILNYFTNFKDKSTDRMPNLVVDLPDLRIPKYFSHSVGLGISIICYNFSRKETISMCPLALATETGVRPRLSLGFLPLMF